MAVRVGFAAGASAWPEYQVPLARALAEVGVVAEVSTLLDDPASVDYLVVAPGGGIEDFSAFVNAKAVLSLWAGVEKIVGNATLTQPLCRMVDPDLTQGMVEYVVGNVLRHHLGLDRYIRGGTGWDQQVPPLSRERSVVILGLGALGQACAAALMALGFPVTGWSRSAKSVPGVACVSGEDGLQAALRRAEILVTLLPKTPETEGMLDARRLGWLSDGAVIINPGRGALIDDDALLAALDAGRLGHATLDVFRVEPLPASHRYWSHPRVTVTPHIAADTRAESAARVVAENIRRGEAGEPFLHLVDRALGY
ncbi:2-hydroxyacid dehydrogenase [Rhodobacter ferrooxidans]|uniref:D-isomer specific 2-hydroxyacid dehydrogenase NAD-binding n=1 Tax=Rhodobacter ferrooxidans TaxID=371731 RepID=C8S009_9RHOB|nr:glyoxylate/hydroxypyruvate reductase A [Rhodobacter sp. SW2]EEW25618.1 D-isomer specific 2-hydroxyacid dehydrogenase NAD-binding [Rhodobacter sp. SW2]